MRVDLLLYNRGFARSRENAKKLIMDGAVFLNGIQIKKPSEIVDDNASITIRDSDVNRYVSRGGLKLEYALKEFKVDVSCAVAIDIGASTGGFTDCLLKHGANKVYAVDVGTGQLHPDIAKDTRVVSIEKCNARDDITQIKEKCDIAVMDVSFISQTLIYKTVFNHLKQDGLFISLIKPQFESGREHLSSGGIVKSEKIHAKIIEKIKKVSFSEGFEMTGVVVSPIKGGDGNTEYLALFRKRRIL